MLQLLAKYKYPLVILFLLLWIFFFAQYDVFTIWGKRSELKEMNKKISYLEKEIKRIEREKYMLKTDDREVEKQSREKYFMKKDNEDVFVYDTLMSAK